MLLIVVACAAQRLRTCLSLRVVVLGYQPKIDLSDERRPLCLSRGQFMRCFFCGAVARAGGDDATEHSRNCYRHNRWVELERTNQNGDENRSAANHEDPPGEDKLATAFNPGRELIHLFLEPHNFVAIARIVHRPTTTLKRDGSAESPFRFMLFEHDFGKPIPHVCGSCTSVGAQMTSSVLSSVSP